MYLCIVIADCPTVLGCIRFPGGQKTVNTPENIGTKYHQFGIFLLNDPNATRVNNIEYDYGEIKRINTEILRE